jgi:hypothetical protein
MAGWYSLWSSFPFWYAWTKKNLATLVSRRANNEPDNETNMVENQWLTRDSVKVMLLLQLNGFSRLNVFSLFHFTTLTISGDFCQYSAIWQINVL